MELLLLLRSSNSTELEETRVTTVQAHRIPFNKGMVHLLCISSPPMDSSRRTGSNRRMDNSRRTINSLRTDKLSSLHMDKLSLQRIVKPSSPPMDKLNLRPTFNPGPHPTVNLRPTTAHLTRLLKRESTPVLPLRPHPIPNLTATSPRRLFNPIRTRRLTFSASRSQLLPPLRP